MSYGNEDMWHMDPTGFCPECGLPEYGTAHDHRAIATMSSVEAQAYWESRREPRE